MTGWPESVLRHRFYAYARGHDARAVWSGEFHSQEQAEEAADRKLEEGYLEIEVKRYGGEVVYTRRRGQERLDGVALRPGYSRRPSALAERAA